VKSEQHKTGRSISGYSFSFKSKTPAKTLTKHNGEQLELVSELTPKQIQLFSSKLAYSPSFSSKYSKAGESYDDFTDRISNDLMNPTKIKEYASYLSALGFK
jgi:plasmid replication initiation protein